jgi:dienelactone hydrolase
LVSSKAETLLQRILAWLKRFWPEAASWAAMGRGWRWSGSLLVVLVALTLFSHAADLYGLLGLLMAVGLVLAVAGIIWLLILALAAMTPGTRWGLLILAVPLIPAALSAKAFAAYYVALLLLVALIAVGVRRLRSERFSSGLAFALAGGLPLLGLSALALLSGWPVQSSEPWPAIDAPPLTLEDPSTPGVQAVRQLSYGSGTDPHRSEFGTDTDWISESVDGSKLLEGWDGLAGWSRTKYWGADAEALPVQGRVWLPEGAGPFPIVLIVHGNHEMSDYSDDGYGYLGELFASRGAITVSVDENFLNSGLADLIGGPEGGLDEESDARAWLLLQHLVQWRQWTADPEHPMFGKADLDRVVLIGHSRGGEAVSEAAVFNRLPRYPDDGSLAFDFQFGIRGVIAIAPVDSQYNPRDRETRPRDLSYLVIHGSHDSDVNAFVGSALFSRLEFVDCSSCFEAAFYLLGANHGQFNTSWGRYDAPAPWANQLNVSPLLDGDAQRQVAKVTFSAFLEVLLHENPEYQAFLARPERGHAWFPDQIDYLSNYQDARQIVLADYEQDADLETGTRQGVKITASGMDLWQEKEVSLRWQNMDSVAVLLGWKGDPESPEPVYELSFDEAGSNWLKPEMTLSFSAAMSTQGPEGVEDFSAPESLDFRIELVDVAGNTAALNLSARRPLYPQVDPVLYKLDVLDGDDASEVVFQRYVFEIREWMAENSALDITSLRAIRFVFPGEVPASLWLDDLMVSPDGI